MLFKKGKLLASLLVLPTVFESYSVMAWRSGGTNNHELISNLQSKLSNRMGLVLK